MARKRASLKDKGEEILGVKRTGQGADILFGTGTEDEPMLASKKDGTAPEIPLPSEDEGLPEGEADLDEEFDLDSLLSAEAEAAEGDAALPELATTPASPVAPSPEPVTQPLLPAPAPPPAVERPVPAPPPPPVSTYSPPPVMERSLPVPVPPPQAAPAPSPAPAKVPPSTETGAPDLSAPRKPRYISLLDDDFDLLAEETSADAIAAALVGAPEATRLTAEQRARLLSRPSVRRKLAELDQAIEGQYDRILRENISVSKPITDLCQNMLAEARSIVLNRKVESLAQAEWYVEQVRARLDRAGESRKQANRYSVPITIWGVAWFAIFVYLVFNPTLLLRLAGISGGGDNFLVPEIFMRTLFFGGIGGVAAVFYNLFEYVSKRKFDSQYILSYVGKPFMGMILGSMIYLTLFLMIRALNFLPGGLEKGSIESLTDVMYAAILFFVAMAAGFKENVAFELLDRVIKTLLHREERKEETGAPPSIEVAS